MICRSFPSPPRGVQVFDDKTAVNLAKNLNNRLAIVINEHPERFAGIASIAPQRPEEAADELERAVKNLGLKGVCINSHTRGEYLDDKKFRVIFQR